METDLLKNYKNQTVRVNFYSLNRLDNVSYFRNECPCCKDGVLTMHRNTNTGELLEVDICCLCGQRFIYEDIELVKSKGGWR